MKFFPKRWKEFLLTLLGLMFVLSVIPTFQIATIWKGLEFEGKIGPFPNGQSASQGIIKKKLDEAVSMLIPFRNERTVVEVWGYTDFAGPKDLNLTISEKRAKGVFDYLHNAIPQIQISWVGGGENQLGRVVMIKGKIKIITRKRIITLLASSIPIVRIVTDPGQLSQEGFNLWWKNGGRVYLPIASVYLTTALIVFVIGLVVNLAKTPEVPLLLPGPISPKEEDSDRPKKITLVISFKSGKKFEVDCLFENGEFICPCSPCIYKNDNTQEMRKHLKRHYKKEEGREFFRQKV